MICARELGAEMCVWLKNGGRKVSLREMTETILACPLFGRRIEFGRLTRLRFGEPQKSRAVS